MNPAPNLVMIGPMGAGKSSIGKRLAERFGLVFVDVDQAIVEYAGASIPAIFDHSGEAAFRDYEKTVLQRLLEQENLLISPGGGAVLDPENRRLIHERSFVVHLRVRVDTQIERLKRCTNRPLLQRADRTQVLQEMAVLREPLYCEIADLTMDTDSLTPGEAIAQLVLRLASQWKMTSTTA